MIDLQVVRDRYQAAGWKVFPTDPRYQMLSRGYHDPANYPAPQSWFSPGKTGLAVYAEPGLLGIDVDAYDGVDDGLRLTP